MLPYEVLHLTDSDSIIADYFPEKEIIERDGMNTDWQGVLLINFVDMERIIHAVETTSVFTEERIQEFSPTYNIILKRDTELDEKTRKFREFLSKETNKGKDYNQGRGRGYQGRGRGYQGKGRGYQGRGYNKEKFQKREYTKQNVNKEIPDLPVYPQQNRKPLEVQKFEL